MVEERPLLTEWVLRGVLYVVCTSNSVVFDVLVVATSYAQKAGERDIIVWFQFSDDTI
ncbi:MAG: hypothetical protein ACRD5J_19775 [Nitrososphaeraceae archaeon]